mmetsp:Transcript_12986/g.39307  ORF Transcript_12986/g.39307 Transcript_12986/m.39307 type:complete len:243 (+) Transcript_12986:683-1411(+)
MQCDRRSQGPRPAPTAGDATTPGPAAVAGVAGIWLARSRGFMAGNSSTSLMLAVSVRSMVRRSMPMPQPAVGGSPYSRAEQKPSSISCASSSPASLSCACSAKRSRCTTGSFSSVYALASSRRFTNSSNRSVMPGLLLCHLARGDMSWGWSVMKVGLMQSTSRNSPTSLSSSLAGVCGGAQSSLCFLHSSHRTSLASDELRSGSLTFSFSSSPDTMDTRGQPGVKSMVMGGSSGPSAWYWMT